MEQTSSTVGSSRRRISRVLISGANGLIGRELSFVFQALGTSVTTLSRVQDLPESIYWNPDDDEMNPELVSGYDAVVHLAGEPVASGRWTRTKKRKIYDSRVHGTAVLAKACASAKEPPKVFMCASGINYYPSSGSTVLDETSSAGQGFLSQVCVGWEQSASILSSLSRVVPLRIGVVLSEKGGTLQRMLPIFRCGLGGYAGTGEDYLSWITLHDLVRAMLHVISSDTLDGPMNLVSPEPVTGRVFAETLGHVLGRPAFVRVPSVLLRLILGQLAEETILNSIRAIPSRLVRDGFVFQSVTIKDGLTSCLA